MAIYEGMLWCDLEATGTKLPESEIIQIGCILTDNKLNEQGHVEFTIRPKAQPEDWGDVARKMHTENGLLEKAMASPIGLGTAELEVLHWLGMLVPDRKTIFHLAGSGVAAYDRPFLNHYMPALAKRLAYSAYDVGHIRRLAKLVGVDPQINEKKDHTSLGDLRCHIAEAKFWLELIKLGAENILTTDQLVSQ